MKQRVITAIVALILFIPIVLMGGIWIDVLVCAFAAVGISEIFIMKKQIIVSWDFILSLLATFDYSTNILTHNNFLNVNRLIYIKDN